jgi:large subunit ribosomal protein L1
MKHGKRYEALRKQVDYNKKYFLKDALALAKKLQSAKFDETLEVSMRLGVNPRHADQLVRGSVILPHGLGKKIRVLALVQGDKEEEAKIAGAEMIGFEDYIKKITEGWVEFDVMVTTPDMMKHVGKLGKFLGARGLMPSPKTGTVTMNIAQAVKDAKAGKVNYKVDKTGNIHSPIGKCSFNEDAIIENAKALIESVITARPATVKGTYVKSIYVSTSMGPGIPIDVQAAIEATK